jgi:cysteine synthase B
VVNSNRLLEQIGGTPLLELDRVRSRNGGARVFAKAEYLNPSGSVKDRAAWAMVKAGIASGDLVEGKSLLDATSGNTGIAYAMIGAALGFRVALCLPKNANLERKRILRAFHAEIIETDPLASSDGALLAARQLYEQHPDLYFYPDQYANDANWRAHYETTAVEIWEQTEGKVTHFLAGMGTSGTFMGTARRLKEFNPAIQTIAMQPDSPLHGLEGMKHMASTIVPKIYRPELIDRTVEIDTDDAYAMRNRLARDQGIFVGPSAGGNVHAAARLAATLPDDAVVVTILCDSGFRYLSDDIGSQP